VAGRIAVLEAVPNGARVFGFALVDRANKSEWTREMRLVYLHHYAVIDREALANGLFANVSQQPLRLRARHSIGRLPALGLPPAEVDWANIFGQYDYVFSSKIDEPYRQFLGQHCELVRQQGDAALYQRCGVVR
jgi:hypothetical protein